MEFSDTSAFANNSRLFYHASETRLIWMPVTAVQSMFICLQIARRGCTASMRFSIQTRSGLDGTADPRRNPV